MPYAMRQANRLAAHPSRSHHESVASPGGRSRPTASSATPGDGTIRFYYLRDAAASSENFDYRAYQPQVLKLSNTYDASTTDVDAFRRKGGKLLIVQGTTDMLVPESMTTAYYEALRQRYGEGLRNFVRYYVVPGFGHGGGTFTSGWDSLTALEGWVEAGQAPLSPTVTDRATGTAGRTRPLCEYPSWPRYSGSGSVDSAQSFTCANG